MPISINPKVAPNTVTGSRGPENLASGRLIPDVAPEMVALVNEAAPLTALSDAKNSPATKRTTQYEFTHFEQDILPLDIEMAASATAGDTTFTLATSHNKRVPQNGLYRHPASGEIVRCTTEPVVSGATIVVSRAWGAADGAPAAASMAAGDKLFFIGTAFPDGASKIRAISTVEVPKRGFTQIFRTSVEVTGRNAHSSTYAGKDWEQQKMMRKREHLRAIDVAGFYGVKSSAVDATTGHLITTTNGLNSIIQSKIVNINEGDFNYDLAVDILKEGMKDGDSGYLNGGSRTKYLFCPMSLQARADKTFNDKVWYEQKVSVPGVEIKGIKTSAGKVLFVYTPVLDDMMYVSGGALYYDAFLVDLNHVISRFHEGRDTQLLGDRQGPSDDTVASEYFSDRGWQFENEAAHMKITVRVQ